MAGIFLQFRLPRSSRADWRRSSLNKSVCLEQVTWTRSNAKYKYLLILHTQKCQYISFNFNTVWVNTDLSDNISKYQLFKWKRCHIYFFPIFLIILTGTPTNMYAFKPRKGRHVHCSHRQMDK